MAEITMTAGTSCLTTNDTDTQVLEASEKSHCQFHIIVSIINKELDKMNQPNIKEGML